VHAASSFNRATGLIVGNSFSRRHFILNQAKALASLLDELCENGQV
jgi:hypothetical protein